MAKKDKQTKKQPTPKAEPAPQPANDSTPGPATEPAGDTTTLAQLAALTADPNVSCPPWPNKRVAVKCPLCDEVHASPVSYVGRLVRRGRATADELRWLREHLTAGGVQIPA